MSQSEAATAAHEPAWPRAQMVGHGHSNGPAELKASAARHSPGSQLHLRAAVSAVFLPMMLSVLLPWRPLSSSTLEPLTACRAKAKACN